MTEPKEPTARICTCYCLQTWGAAIAAPYVPTSTTEAWTSWLPPVKTVTETGDEFWTATVVQKTYDCDTKVVQSTTQQTLNLVHNTYSTSWTKRFFLNLWPLAAGWVIGTPGPYANTGNLGDKAALGTSSPPATPHCPDDGVACP